MVFSSLFFIYMFLALNLLCYCLAGSMKTKNMVMLVFSLIFYAFAGPKYLILLVALTFVSWYTALRIGRSKRHSERKLFLIIDVVVLLGTLCFFKYTGFFLGNLQFITGVPKEIPTIVLPIGISFYTFQLLSYTIDVYRREVKYQPHYLNLLLYASLFHQCIAGPIVRYQTVAHEINHRYATNTDISEGILRFSIGLTKKAVLANTCAGIIKELVPSTTELLTTTPTMNLWLGMFCFMLQIYLDFSAYSDMAIGMGLMIGFHYDENFNYPYSAASITGFWRRWHISLSSFFRDYVYIPLGGNREGVIRTIFNLFVVWALTGFWHGASWNFILWGIYYFVLLIIEKFVLLKVLKKASGPVALLTHLYTLVFVFFGWVIFYFDKLSDLGIALRNMFRIGIDSSAVAFSSIQSGLQFENNIFILIIAVLACFPIYRWFREYMLDRSRDSVVCFHIIHIFDILTIVFCFIISTMALVGNSYNPFLYFRF